MYLYALLICTTSIQYPTTQIAFMTSDSSTCTEIINSWSETIEAVKQYCDIYEDYELSKDDCLAVDAMKTPVCGPDDSVLSNVDSSVDMLTIGAFTSEAIDIDLNKLPSQMVVIFAGYSIGYSKHEEFTKLIDPKAMITKVMKRTLKYHSTSTDKVLKYSSKILPKNLRNSLISRNPKVSSSHRLNGAISGKVSFLSISVGSVLFTSDLNVHSASFILSYVDPDSKNIRCNTLIVDTQTIDHFFRVSKLNSELIRVHQFCCLELYVHYEVSQILFLNDGWDIFYKSSSNKYHFHNGNEIVPYEWAEQFNMISLYLSYELVIDDQNDNLIIKPVNITITTLSSGDQGIMYNAEDEIVVKTIGDRWSEVQTEMILTYDHSLYSADTSECKVSIRQDNLYVYEPKGDDGLPVGAIVGIAIACVVVVGAIVGLVIFFVIRNKKKHDQSSNEGN